MHDPVGKHSLTRKSRRRGYTRGAIIVGALAAAVLVPELPSVAQPISVPGVGNVEIPDIPPNILDPLATPQAQSLISQAPPQVQQVVNQVLPGQSVGARALAAAQTRLGTPYRWGGADPNGFDCSGLVSWSYAQAGMRVPRTSYEQAHFGTPVPLNDLRPGDVVIYNHGEHAALYAGNGQIVQAPRTGDRVKYSPVGSMPIAGARRAG